MGVAKQDWMYEAETRWSGNGGGWDGEISHPLGPYPKFGVSGKIYIYILGGGFQIFLFSTILGEME